MTAVDELSTRLAEAPGDTDALAAARGLPEDERAALVDALKARVDAAVRAAPADALPASEALAALADAVPTRRALCLRGRAVALHAAGRSGEALPHYRDAVRAYDAAGEDVEAARVRRSLVDVLQMSGDADGALAEAALAREVLERHGERVLLAQLECNVGNVHFRLDRFEDAARHYDGAVRIFDDAGETFGAAFALHNLGNVLANAHAFEDARRHFERARDAFVANGHDVLAADCEYGLAYLAFREGRFERAIAELERLAVRYADGLKPTGEPLCHLDLAEIHLALGAEHEARRHARIAAEAFAALGMEYERAKARLFEGVAAWRSGDATEAAPLLEDARAAFETLGNSVRAALVVLQIATLNAGAVTDVATVERARSALEASGDRFLARAGALAVAEARLASGDAATASDELVRVVEEGADASGLLATTAVEARRLLARCSSDGDQAEHHLRAAVELVERTFAGLAWADARLAFLGARQDVFVRLAGLLLERGGAARASEALEMVEQGRQRSLEERPLGAALRAPDALALRRSLDARLARSMESVLGRAERPSGNAGRAAATAPAEEAALGEEMDGLLRSLRAASRQGARDGPAAAPPRPSEVLRSGECAVRFVVDSDTIHAVVDAPDGMRAVARCPVGADFVRAAVARLRFHVRKLGHGAAYLERHTPSLDRGVERLLDELGRGLLAPVAGELRAERVVLVPHGPLHDVPLHALHVDGAPLFERVETAYARGLRQLARSRRAAATAGRVALLGHGGDSLPAVERELAALAGTHGASAERLDADAWERRVLDGERFAAVHVAAHGAHRADHPLFSGLQLGERALTALDLGRLDLEGAIVTLSGCETSRHAVGREEDPFGPEAAFLAAGARAVVGALDVVEDAATETFMGTVHGALAEGATAGAAVRSALSEAREGPRGALRAASWVLVGDGAARLGTA